MKHIKDLINKTVIIFEDGEPTGDYGKIQRIFTAIPNEKGEWIEAKDPNAVKVAEVEDYWTEKAAVVPMEQLVVEGEEGIIIPSEYEGDCYPEKEIESPQEKQQDKIVEIAPPLRKKRKDFSVFKGCVIWSVVIVAIVVLIVYLNGGFSKKEKYEWTLVDYKDKYPYRTYYKLRSIDKNIINVGIKAYPSLGEKARLSQGFKDVDETFGFCFKKLDKYEYNSGHYKIDCEKKSFIPSYVFFCDSDGEWIYDDIFNNHDEIAEIEEYITPAPDTYWEFVINEICNCPESQKLITPKK